MSDTFDVFLSYSHNDPDAAAVMRAHLKRAGLRVFWDKTAIQEGDRWMDAIQDAVDACRAFVVLVGRDGVRRWVGAETQVALNRHFGPHDDADRLPIYPVLLDGSRLEDMPAFLRLFQTTAWEGSGALPEGFLDTIRARIIVPNTDVRFEGCPFVGLDAFRVDQAHLFFGRQQETLDALACFDRQPGARPVRWLEINGNSGSGKSSLMQAGLLPLIDQGMLWGRTRIEHWRRVGPMMPGARPVEMLAEVLARAFDADMGETVRDLYKDENALRFWLRKRKQDDTAALLAIDQFEELFTFAEPEERRHVDALLTMALSDPDCPFYLITTVRSDFLDRFATDLPKLVAVRNRLARPWTLAPIGEDGLREVIEGPARLAGLDVSEITEAIVAEARDEPGVLPLVENALTTLWERREGNRLSGRLFTELGGLAGMLSRNADALLADLAADGLRDTALDLLLRLVRIDPEGNRHARRRLPFDEAVDLAGGGERGRALVSRLAGVRDPGQGLTGGPVRLVTITSTEEGQWVSLIHETLIRAKDVDGAPIPYWPTLWDHIEQHKEEAALRARIAEETAAWIDKSRDPAFQWSHERVREAVAVMGTGTDLPADQRAFLGPTDPKAMLAEIDDRATDHKRRLLIGERLAILGDPRPGIDVDADGTPDIAWCDVEGGTVTIEITADPTVIGSKVVDRKTKTVKPFRIARYPLTVAQYRAFMEAEDGWRDAAWWGDDLYRTPDGDTYDFGRFGNHPAVYVSWFDAMAFCRWLSHRSGLDARLPDEWEWQQAAGGGNDFPWGAAEWDASKEPWRANTRESRLSQSTAVGLYPGGAARCGALDLGGTVWEWCLGKIDKPEVTKSGSRDFDARVLRGGSWNNNQDAARAGNRNRNHPNNRNNNIGFRVVVSSPSPGR